MLGYPRIGKSICRSVHILTEELEQGVVRSIPEQLSSPEWKGQVRETLQIMVQEEFGESAEQIQGQLVAINRQIASIVEAIKTSGRFSEAMNRAPADLETQRDSIPESLGEAERRMHQQIGAEALAEKIMTTFGNFDTVWNDGLGI